MDRHFAVAYIAIQQRRRTLASDAHGGGDRHNPLVQPGIAGARPCPDGLLPAPAQPLWVARLVARFRTGIRALARRESEQGRFPPRLTRTG
jgi:hypothetical protein